MVIRRDCPYELYWLQEDSAQQYFFVCEGRTNTASDVMHQTIAARIIRDRKWCTS